MKVISYNFERKIVNFLFKLKKHLHILRTVSAFCIFLGMNFLGFSQDINPPDTLNINPVDSAIVTLPSDTTVTDTVKVAEESDISDPINYSARDSILFDVTGKVIYLFGESKIEYGDITLLADKVEVNWTTNIMTATGTIDSTGKLVGRPEFFDKEDQYRADTIRYNIATKKGLIVGVVTQEGEGFIHADRGKKDQYNNVYFNEAKYTTCNLEHPHFYISARKLKVIPDDKVVSGPFNLVIADVPTPFGFLFGYFPIPEKRKSGIIFPQDFGEDNNMGFFIRQGG